MIYQYPDVEGLIPSATVVIFRKSPAGGSPQLLMVQRSKEMRFAGGAAVFPGGRLDQADYDLAAKLNPLADGLILASRIAGIRETLEETGLAIGLSQTISAQEAATARKMLIECGALGPVLDHFNWTLAPDQLTPFARWTPNMKGTFDTLFFITDLGTGKVDISIDATENTKLFWVSAAEALELAAQKEISIIFPTRRNLERLALFASFAEAQAQCEAIPVKTISPITVERNGAPWLVIPDYKSRGYPIEGEAKTNLYRG